MAGNWKWMATFILTNVQPITYGFPKLFFMVDLFTFHHKGLKEYHKNLKKKRCKYNPGIEKAPWIDLCLEVKDPFIIS